MRNLLIFMFIVCFTILCTSLSFGQEIIFRGIVRDSTTKEVLSNVRIGFNNDMEVAILNKASEFQINVEKGTKIWFRVRGYRWKNVVATGESNDTEIIELPPSPKGLPKDWWDGNPQIAFYFNGTKIPYEDWNDIRFYDIKIPGDLNIRTNGWEVYYNTY